MLNSLLTCFSDYKEKIGLKCQFLIEPKAKEPMKHQYDYGICGLSSLLDCKFLLY